MSGYEGTHRDWLEGQASDALEREEYDRDRREETGEPDHDGEHDPNSTRGAGAFTWGEHKVIVAYQDEYELAFNSHDEAVRAAHAILSEVEIARRAGQREIRCPLDPVPVVSGTPGTIAGCGQIFSASPDEDGWVDCPNCGLGFNPDHPENTEIAQRGDTE